MKNETLTRLVNDLKERGVKHSSYMQVKKFENYNVYINNIKFIKEMKQIYFNNINDDILIIKIYAYFTKNQNWPKVYIYKLDKALQIEYACNKDGKVQYNIPINVY